MPRLLSLFADLGRLPSALVVWNWRKTHFRVKGARGRCACQHPSDSGAAGETGCEACVEWSKPQRFRWVCPLLVPGEHGWHCAVHAEDVRPFWGRAIGIFASLALAIYVGVVSVFFGTLGITGVEQLTWLDVAWPGRWGRIPQARAAFFSARAGQLLQQADFVGAELSVLSALQLAPGRYEPSLFLAHLRQYQRNYADSDGLFRRLLNDFPARSRETALAWHDALLLRQRYPELAALALHMTTAAPEMAPLWRRSALFALRQMPDAVEFVARNGDVIGALPEPSRALFAAEERLRRGDHAGAMSRLLEAGVGPLEPALVREYVEQLLRLRERERAEALLARHAPSITAFDRRLLQMRIDAASGDAALVRIDFERLLEIPLNIATLQLLAAWLVEHPDGRSFERLHRRVSADELVKLSTGGEMWLAAVACGARAEAVFWAKDCARRLGFRVPAVESLALTTDDMTNPASVPRLIVAARLPHEVILGLLQRAAAARRGELVGGNSAGN